MYLFIRLDNKGTALLFHSVYIIQLMVVHIVAVVHSLYKFRVFMIHHPAGISVGAGLFSVTAMLCQNHKIFSVAVGDAFFQRYTVSTAAVNVFFALVFHQL